MSENPFSPPLADVADPKPAPLGKRPTQVVVATWLLGLSIVGVLISTVITVTRTFAGVGDWPLESVLVVTLIPIVIGVIGSSIWTVLTVKVFAAKKWARTAMIVCVLIEPLLTVILLLQATFPFSWRIVYGLWPEAIRGVAIALLYFGSGKLWFSQQR